MEQMTCWTATDFETQPWVECIDQRLRVSIVVGIWTAFDCPENSLHVEISAISYSGSQGVAVDSSRITCVALTADGFFVPREKRAADPIEAKSWLEDTRRFADVRNRVMNSDHHNNAETNKYFLVQIEGVPEDDLLRVVATAYVTRPIVMRVAADPLGIWVSDPRFTVDDVVAAHAEPEADDEECWILMHRRDGRFDHFRIDLLATQNPRPALSPINPIHLRFGGREVDLASPAPAPDAYDADWVGSWVDRSADSIVVTVPSSEPLCQLTVVTRADQPDPTAVAVEFEPRSGGQPAGSPATWRPVALMIMGYAIQGLNDLFWHPAGRVNDGMLSQIDRTGKLDALTKLPAYDPPRSYAQITYSDEYAVFSGKPEKPENNIVDGYRFMLKAQQAYGINAVWAFNAGTLLLLSQGLEPAWWAEIVDAVATGVISPAMAGFGAHRAAYYDAEANRRELTENDTLMRRLFGRSPNGIYFPDSRIYKHARGEVDGLAGAGSLVRYLVLDRSTIATEDEAAGDHRQRLLFANPDPERLGNFVWHDRDTRLAVLLIEDVLRDNLVNASADQGYRGMVPLEVRRLAMRSFALDQEGPRRLFLAADDIEHFCGAGWFDGSDVDFAAGYLTALCWISLHPWIEVVTTEKVGGPAAGGDQPTFDDQFVRGDRMLAISSAIDATMDPGGAASVDHGTAFYFDLWYEAWARFPATWLGCTLADIGRPLEQMLTQWPQHVAGYDKDLHRLAWIYYLSCTHEGFWSKQPSGSRWDPRDYPFAWDPEDFAVSESLQMRNAWVYLNASIWAYWAARTNDDRDYVMTSGTTSSDRAGWLLARIRAGHAADRWWAPGGPQPYHDDGLFWDRDNLSNTILYNRELLAVLDANGGVISHLFVRTGDRAISVSGTCKAYQFLTLNPQVPCDGPRVQNTVFTPNHAYVGSDVLQARPWFGSFLDQRRTAPEPCWWPNNLDRYACEPLEDRAGVRLTYTGVDVSRLPKEPVSESVAMQAMEHDGRCLRAGLPGVVWHRDPEFRKSITLSGRTLFFGYEGVRPDHVVANEFTLDLLGQLLGDPAQSVSGRVDAEPGTVTIAAPGVEVAVSTVSGCLLTAGRGGLAEPLGHRVLTDSVLIAPAPGDPDFSYAIVVTPTG